MEFEWDERKNKMNISKHKVSFFEAQDAFFDANRLIRKDVKHSDFALERSMEWFVR